MYVTAIAPHVTVALLTAVFFLAQIATGSSHTASTNPDRSIGAAATVAGLGLLAGLWLEWRAWRHRWHP